MIKYLRVKEMNKKVVLITGSSSGLGASTARLFAKNDYNVVINYLTHENNALELKKELESKYHIEVLCIKADVSNEDDVKNMADEVIKSFGHLDVLVNNAGIAIDTLFENKTKEIFMRTLEVNLYGTFLVSQIFGKIMFDNKKGKIINISSTNGLDTYYEYSLDYDASKAGIINLTHNLANHFAPYLNVNCVCPGWMKTPMNDGLDEDQIKEEESNTLLKRFAEPDEVANIVYFLATDEASYVTDSIIRVDGGLKC